MKRLGEGLRAAAFAAACLIMVYLVCVTLAHKTSDGYFALDAFYKQDENSIDVLVLGSSHAGMNLTSDVLWDEYGLASFLLWGAEQPLWTSYYDLVEALKTQTPKVVVQEVYSVILKAPHLALSRDYENLARMRFSANKVAAVKAMTRPEYWLDLLAGLPVTHTRYGELTRTDFQYYAWNDGKIFKGDGPHAGPLTGVKIEVEDASSVTQTAELYPDCELYLRKIIELCADKDLPLVLLVTPQSNRAVNRPVYNRVEQIAQEYGVPFLNCDLLDDETGLDPEHDFQPGGFHLNHIGAAKITRYLGQYLVENYDLPDRRGTPGYESWETASQIVKNEQLPYFTDVDEYISLLSVQPYRFYLTKTYGPWEDETGLDTLRSQLAKLGFDENVLDALGDIYGMEAVAGAESDVSFYTDYETNTVTVDGQTVCQLDGTDLALVVYDTNTDTVLDVRQCGPAGKFCLIAP